MKAYNPDEFECSKENTGYIKLKCISCNKPVVLLARLSDGHRCRFCNGYMRSVGYVRRKDQRQEGGGGMNKTCDTCKHVNVREEDYPCRVCTHSYIDRWEKATFDDLIDPLLTLAGLQIDKGNHDAVEICKAVIKLIEEEK